MDQPDDSLLLAEITQASKQAPEKLVLTDEQLAGLAACVRWKNDMLRVNAKSGSYSRIIVDPDGFHKVQVGPFIFNVQNWCTQYEDFKRRLGLQYKKS